MKSIQDFIELQLCFDGVGREVEVLDVIQLDDDIYRIEENPVFTENVAFGDVIRVKPSNDVSLYIETIEKSRYTRHNWLLSKEVIYSVELKILKNKIRNWQGKSQQVFGGIFIVNLPADTEVDINNEVQKVIETVQK
ncbi:DUF4265 domain-containing protein [Paenibacillus sp. Soil522]|uniref:DUF4265 domain-containing protein n=1 Tax=Paenibacillus sp. Soil522 TaxID=1736388 RepID=UPI0006FF39C1|nr:DUF4265 domain-containing protein [Paenibacillus sp. Soil522]KRE48742.1 hypothetical protein ASG81_05950 [Paenibacillus sp. Soil522]